MLVSRGGSAGALVEVTHRVVGAAVLHVRAAHRVPAQGAAPPLPPAQLAAGLIVLAGVGGGGAGLVTAQSPGPGQPLHPTPSPLLTDLTAQPPGPGLACPGAGAAPQPGQQ